jgi:hypothetical protein
MKTCSILLVQKPFKVVVKQSPSSEILSEKIGAVHLGLRRHFPLRHTSLSAVLSSGTHLLVPMQATTVVLRQKHVDWRM